VVTPMTPAPSTMIFIEGSIEDRDAAPAVLGT
jgi:hypothetical protein